MPISLVLTLPFLRINKKRRSQSTGHVWSFIVLSITVCSLESKVKRHLLNRAWLRVIRAAESSSCYPSVELSSCQRLKPSLSMLASLSMLVISVKDVLLCWYHSQIISFHGFWRGSQCWNITANKRTNLLGRFLSMFQPIWRIRNLLYDQTILFWHNVGPYCVTQTRRRGRIWLSQRDRAMVSNHISWNNERAEITNQTHECPTIYWLGYVASLFPVVCHSCSMRTPFMIQ